MYYSCDLIDMFAFNINGRMDGGVKCVALCCESIEDKPAIPFEGSSEEILEKFFTMRLGVIEEGKRYLSNEITDGRKYTLGCVKCANYKLGDWHEAGLIHYVNLSMYPAPCQSKCIYCGVHKGKSGSYIKEKSGQYYERLFNMLDLARQKGIIAPNATWQISSGEIAIHPYKDRIFDLVENQRATFYTNAFIFDERIAMNLQTNPYSAINVSIDAGTPNTWFEIKGVDNFEEVAMNLVKYFNSSSRAGQITLKYIVLPGINNTLGDYKSLIEMMKILKVNHLTISRDTSIKYSISSDETKQLIIASAYILALLSKNGLSADMFTYTPSEQEQAIELAKRLIESESI